MKNLIANRSVRASLALVVSCSVAACAEKGQAVDGDVDASAIAVKQRPFLVLLATDLPAAGAGAGSGDDTLPPAEASFTVLVEADAVPASPVTFSYDTTVGCDSQPWQVVAWSPATKPAAGAFAPASGDLVSASARFSPACSTDRDPTLLHLTLGDSNRLP